MKKAFFVAVIFLFIYSIPFSFSPIGSGKLFAIGSFLYLFILFFIDKTSFLANRKIFTVASLLIVLNIITYLLPIVYRTGDFSLNYQFNLMLLEDFLGCFIIIKLMDKFDVVSSMKFIEYSHLAIFIQSLIIILMIAQPPFKQFVFSLSRTEGEKISVSANYVGFRGMGLAGSLLWDFSTFQSIGLLLSAVLIPHLKTYKAIIFHFFAFLIIAFSVFVTGRTGQFGLILALIWIIKNSINVKAYNSDRYRKFILVFVIGLLAVVGNYKLLLPGHYVLLLEEKIIPYAFESIINKASGGGFETESSNELKEHYFKVEPQTVLIGDGYYTSPTNKDAYYKDTDAGYMRILLFGGIFFSLLLYFLYLFIFYKAYMFSKHLAIRRLPSLILIITVIYFLVHYKGDLLTGSRILIKFLYLFFFVITFEYHKFISNGRTNS
ncbi:MAG: hypothetical protein MUC81_04500 [Bacteroidia bacterium]|jgi:hypothetical protein|nr:hypothetical protein [Bacteroidia bacterium]